MDGHDGHEGDIFYGADEGWGVIRIHLNILVMMTFPSLQLSSYSRINNLSRKCTDCLQMITLTRRCKQYKINKMI